MHVKVTKTNIQRGVKGRTFSCPIALAIKRGLGKKRRSGVWVGEDNFSLGLFEGFPKHELPLRARDFIRRFDKGEKVKPFEFELVTED